MIVHFVNLTNGIEALPHLEEVRFTRIQSTALEQKRWDDVLRDAGPELYLHLALGNEVIVWDYSNSGEQSRALWQGLEFIRFTLERMWFGRVYTPARACMAESFERGLRSLHPTTLSRLRYYKKFLRGKRFTLVGAGGRTTYDGQYEHYARLLWAWADQGTPALEAA